MASELKRLPSRERRPSMGAPIVDIQGAVGPAGATRPKHTRTATGFGAGEIKTVEGMFWSLQLLYPTQLWFNGLNGCRYGPSWSIIAGLPCLAPPPQPCNAGLIRQ